LVLKNYIRFLAVVVLMIVVAGCGKKTEGPGSESGKAPLPTAATLGEQVVLSAEEYLAAEPYAAASQSRGERQAQICRACHSLEKGGPNMIGPALFGFFGKEVGTRSGFEYSAVMRNAGFTWTPEALNAWLAQPGRFLPGNRMTFAGVSRQGDRDDLIAYLLAVTSADTTEQQE
jgi:cytochrome c